MKERRTVSPVTNEMCGCASLACVPMNIVSSIMNERTLYNVP